MRGVDPSAAKVPAGAARWLELPVMSDGRGSLTFMEHPRHLPWPIADIAWYCAGAQTGVVTLPRAVHPSALAALAGEVAVELSENGERTTFSLAAPNRVLLVPVGSRMTLVLSPRAVLLGVALAEGASPPAPRETPERERGRLSSCRSYDFPRLPLARDGVAGFGIAGAMPFPLARIYYMYELRPELMRGAHAHIATDQMIIAARGSFALDLDDGQARRRVRLERPQRGARRVPMVWGELTEFSRDAVCLVFASRLYDADDYLRDYGTYLKRRREAAVP